MTDDEQTDDSAWWPKRCKHLEAGVLEKFGILTMTNAPGRAPGGNDVAAAITLCPFCCGQIIAVIRKTLQEAPDPNPNKAKS